MPLSVDAVTRIDVLTVAPLDGVVMVRVVAYAVALKSSKAAVAKYRFFTEISFFVRGRSGTKLKGHLLRRYTALILEQFR